ncbi:L-aspartate oxidase [bacterium BMS3Bbin12]|nr:L-aspartate oxidase [bacterium BMS3Abin12]GBE47560.1 L-aspartate oxidase [bacterium BMS3Bbin12]GBE50989.1 L-aspartate oxidase [bacterium BMS3Bbin13]
MSPTESPERPESYDVLVIGSGAAGLGLALRLAPHARVAVLSKGALQEGGTYYAQGGVSAVLDESDSVDAHVADTLDAGAGLCDEEIVRFTVERGPAAIRRLVDIGVPFTRVTRSDGSQAFHLTREGGHGHRRVIHAADASGRAIESTLLEHVRAQPSVTLLADHMSVDLITGRKLGLDHDRCVGAYVLDRKRGRVEAIAARFVILATGGASRVYLYTSNPDVSTGDGVAMAWRAGCRIVNLEFIQFHPTCLFHPKAKSFLISEAVRGEGGRLLLPDGTRFMERFDPRGELAPRDIVARAIDHEMKRLGIDSVLLDISHKPAEFIRAHFPNIHARCLELGYDLTRGPVPVVPAAHYTCGGVATDRHGRTDIEGLYAVGEVAFTGLHGANRMASNSLLECLVFSETASADIRARLPDAPPPPRLPAWDESRVSDSDEMVVVSHNWQELRRFMWDYVGIVRTTKRLERALRRAELLRHEISEYYGNFRVTHDLLELRNLALVAELIIRSAMSRTESRGLHYTLDYPQPDTTHPPRNTVLTPPPAGTPGDPGIAGGTP